MRVKCINDKLGYCGLVEGQEYDAFYLNDEKKDIVINGVCLPLSLFEVIEEDKPKQIGGTHYGIKHDQEKLKPTLLFDDMPLAIQEMLKVLKYGADKYAEGNWLKVDNGESRYRNACDRHRLQSSIEEYDAESGLLHLAHEAVNAVMLLELKLRDK